MISLVTHAADLPRVRGPFSLRIVAAARAYGLEAPFLDVWQGNGCWFSRMDGVLTLAGVPEPEGREETRLFLAASGAGEIFCAPEAAAALGLVPDQEGPVLWRKQPGERGPLLGEQPSPRVIYPVLEACRGPYFPVPSFEPFYLDLSHRFRHGAAAGVVLEEAGMAAACAVAAAVTEEAALLTAVAVRPEFRRKGLGRKAVEQLGSHLPGREMYLFRAKEENQAFYAGLGFIPRGGWACIKV